MKNDSKIDDQLDAKFAPAWRREDDPKIVGEVTTLSEREGAYGRYPIVTVRTQDGERAIHAFHEVLANELARIAPKVGDKIGVKYLGKHPERSYHRYRAVKVGDEEGVDWSRYGGDGDAPTSDVPGDTSDLPPEKKRSYQTADDDIPF